MITFIVFKILDCFICTFITCLSQVYNKTYYKPTHMDFQFAFYNHSVKLYLIICICFAKSNNKTDPLLHPLLYSKYQPFLLASGLNRTLAYIGGEGGVDKTLLLGRVDVVVRFKEYFLLVYFNSLLLI